MDIFRNINIKWGWTATGFVRVPVLYNFTMCKEFQESLQKNSAGQAVCPIIIYTALSGFTRSSSLMQQLPIISYAYVLPT